MWESEAGIDCIQKCVLLVRVHILSAVYTQHRIMDVLKISHNDAGRMQMWVVQGKGKKDRYTPLPEKRVALLKSYLAEYRPSELLIEVEGGGA